MSEKLAPNRQVLLVYDEECPACNWYCRLARIRTTVGDLQLVNAREPGEVMSRISAAGLDIDQGMVLIIGSEMYYGSDAIHMLSMLSTRSGLFNRLSFHLFRSKRVAAFLYPVLRACRNLLLKILRKSRINNLDIVGNDRF
jgi:predicted DCC family thiol-disulfide oxidoreductase YuxK